LDTRSYIQLKLRTDLLSTKKLLDRNMNVGSKFSLRCRNKDKRETLCSSVCFHYFWERNRFIVSTRYRVCECIV